MYYLLSELNSNLIHATDSIRKKYYAAVFQVKISIELTEEEQIEFLKNIEKEKRYKNNEKYILENYPKARGLENVDNQKAIELYEIMMNMNHHRDILDRLIILYRKTKQKEKEIQAIEWLIEEEQNRQYNRMKFSQLMDPESADFIEDCYNNKLPFINKHGYPINFFTKINRLNERLQKLNKL